MMVCQPVNKDKLYFSASCYEGDGVEYVEPHLLPCTLCLRAPSVKYQTKMLEMERGAPLLTENLSTAFLRAATTSGADRYDPLAAQLQKLLPTIPRCHTAFFDILLVNVKVRHLLDLEDSHGVYSAAMQAAVAR